MCVCQLTVALCVPHFGRDTEGWCVPSFLSGQLERLEESEDLQLILTQQPRERVIWVTAERERCVCVGGGG